MRIGDLVRMHARSLEHVYGLGIIVRDLRSTQRLQVQVFWSKYGLGNKVNIHSLEKLSGSKEG